MIYSALVFQEKNWKGDLLHKFMLSKHNKKMYLTPGILLVFIEDLHMHVSHALLNQELHESP